MKQHNYRDRQPRIAQLMRQHHADRADRAPCPIRINPMLDSRADCNAYGHAQASRQDRLKRQRRAERRAKQAVNSSDAYLAMYRDLWEFLNIPGYEDIAWF